MVPDDPQVLVFLLVNRIREFHVRDHRFLNSDLSIIEILTIALHTAIRNHGVRTQQQFRPMPGVSMVRKLWRTEITTM